MYYSLIHIPKTDRTSINEFRKKYDPYESLVDSHITLVFPVKDSEVSREALVAHTESVLSGWQPFDIKIKGIEKAWDNWMFLLLEDGNEQVIKLHDDLYRGLLAKELRTDIEFVPHIAVGLFTKGNYDLRDPEDTALDEEKYNLALKEMELIGIDRVVRLNELQLIEIDDKFTKSKIIHTFTI